ncbi:MAG TPA: TolC family protein [Candidatus Binataceae bacterium]|nr:TolC family protein [Candidatus Binataceae bacterium]
MKIRVWPLVAALGLLCAGGARAGESAPSVPSPLTLRQAVNYALMHQPAISGQQALQEQAAANVERSRAGYVQQVDASESTNWAQAAHNPVGLYLPVPGFPVSEGPRTSGSFGSGAWNGATSVFMSEDVVALVRQMSVVDSALARLSQQSAAADEQTLLVAFSAAQAFMNQVSATEIVKAAQAGVTRAQAFEIAVKGLVDSGLRPGADLARADAELALARNQEITAERDQRVGWAALAQTLGAPDISRTPVEASDLLRQLPRAELPGGPSPVDPLVREATAAIKSTRYSERAAKLEYLPRVSVVAGVFGRGSGFGFGGSSVSPGSGTLPNNFNLAAGVVLTVPLEQILTAHADVDIQHADEKYRQAQYRQTALQLRTQFASAVAIFDSAQRVAANTPIELAAARATQKQTTAQYRPGLASALDVATANSLLTQAEVDDAMARINVWQALSLVWRAAGDLNPFLAADQLAAQQGSR